jgi:4-amino-4-deoxy-L-arabinose transferase-like glycosyltransferase
MTTQAKTETTRGRLMDKAASISSRTILLIIIVTAIALRMGSAAFQGNNVTELPGISDQVSYDGLARRVVGGYGFSFAEGHWPMTPAGEPTAHWSFLYTLYLAAFYAVFGAQPILPRLIQALIVGGLQVYVTYRIGEKMFSGTVGLIAAAISALYIYFVYYSGSLMTEPFYITAILCSLFITIQLSEDPGRSAEIKHAILLGLALGVAVLLRQVFLLFIPFLLLWLWVARLKRHLSLPILSTIMSLGLVVLFMTPFVLYNHSRFGRYILNTNSGFAFYWGNHPIYGTHFMPILPVEMGTYQDLVPVELRSLDEAALDQALLRRGLQFVIDDPKRYILLSLSRIPFYFEFWPSAGSGLISNISRVGSFGLALPFMIYGLFLAVKRVFSEKGNWIVNLFTSPTGLLLLFAVIYTSIHILTWTLIRYRLPVDAALIPFAGLAIFDLYSRVNKRFAITKQKQV